MKHADAGTHGTLHGANGATRVLIVDDNEDAVDLLQELLTETGYSVRTAFDGPSALLVARDFMPQVALVNIGLPVMDGHELGRRLRELYQTLRMVAVTGYGTAAAKARSLELGFDAHLVKPVGFVELKRLIQSFV